MDSPIVFEYCPVKNVRCPERQKGSCTFEDGPENCPVELPHNGLGREEVPNVDAIDKMKALRDEIDSYATKCYTIDDVMELSTAAMAARRDIKKYIGYVFREGGENMEVHKQLVTVLDNMMSYHKMKMEQLIKAISECGRTK